MRVSQNDWDDRPRLRGFVQFKDSIAVATNSRSMIFVTVVRCVRWCVCVFAHIYSGASLRLSVYV